MIFFFLFQNRNGFPQRDQRRPRDWRLQRTNQIKFQNLWNWKFSKLSNFWECTFMHLYPNFVTSNFKSNYLLCQIKYCHEQLMTLLSELFSKMNNSLKFNWLGWLKYQKERSNDSDSSVCGSCAAGIIFVFSWILIMCTFPFSLCFCIKMVQVLIINFVVMIENVNLQITRHH